MSADLLPGAGASQQDSGQVTRIENLSVGYTPEALTRKVTKALNKFRLTGVEGRAFERLFSLRVQGETDGFVLESPPRAEPWDSAEDFIPDIRAQVSTPSEWLPDGQIIWMDKSTIWNPRDEISNGQKILIVLDELLGPLEAAKTPGENGEHRKLMTGEEQSPK